MTFSLSYNRFGPLVWRTSKERRKTKSYRRDKCNSGDSGIQVELENDENLSENIHHFPIQLECLNHHCYIYHDDKTLFFFVLC